MKHSEIKGRIIETASHLFYTNGYNATGINEIIAEAGIAKATLYSHFKSKEDICLAYLAHRHDAFMRDIKAFCNEKPTGRHRVLGVFDFLQEFFKGKDFNGCWCIKTVSEIPRENEKIRHVIQQQKVQFLAFLKDIITKNIKGIPDGTIEQYAKHLYLLYESAVAESHLHQKDWPIHETKAMYNQLIK